MKQIEAIIAPAAGAAITGYVAYELPLVSVVPLASAAGVIGGQYIVKAWGKDPKQPPGSKKLDFMHLGAGLAGSILVLQYGLGIPMEQASVISAGAIAAQYLVASGDLPF